jgi:hypothetical protein
MKRKISLALVVAFVFALSPIFVACGKPAAHTHTWDDNWIVTPATCVAKGSKTRTCTGANCTHTDTQEIAIDPTAHNIVDNGVEQAATCTAVGIMNTKCDREGCTHTGTREIAKILHALDYGLGGAKPWEQSCACGHKTNEIDYREMTLPQFFAEMTNNEGNYVVDCYGDEGGYVHYWAVNGETSYRTSPGSDWEEYYTIIGNNVALSFYTDDGIQWSAGIGGITNIWLDGDGWIFIDERGDDHGIKVGDFKDGATANTYVLINDKQEIWGNDATCEITFNKDNIIMEFVEFVGSEEVAYTYTITLGNCPPIELPTAVQELHETVIVTQPTN